MARGGGSGRLAALTASLVSFRRLPSTHAACVSAGRLGWFGTDAARRRQTGSFVFVKLTSKKARGTEADGSVCDCGVGLHGARRLERIGGAGGRPGSH